MTPIFIHPHGKIRDQAFWVVVGGPVSNGYPAADRKSVFGKVCPTVRLSGCPTALAQPPLPHLQRFPGHSTPSGEQCFEHPPCVKLTYMHI